MSRRTFEGPMDWEYQSTGPIDMSSPFAKVAQGPRNSGFDSSPSKFGRQTPNPFAAAASHSSSQPLSPSKQQQPQPPHTSFFNPKLQPQLQNKFSAPAFRNPAFTTPQKRRDELAFSEMSGAESSPGVTDASELPEDTPDVDRSEDFGRMTITQSAANRTLFGASTATGSKVRSRTPGRGELTSRRIRDTNLRGKVRKRPRQERDKDVGSARSRLQNDSDDSDSEWEQDAGGKAKRRRNKQGWFSAMVNNPSAPMILSKWVQLGVNCLLIGGVFWMFWGLISMVRSDLAQATEQARSVLLAEMQQCTHEYTKNRCSPKSERLPALAAVCDEWEMCMNQDPTSVMKVQVSAKNVAEIINEFVGVMTVKAWIFILSVLIVVIIANNVGFGRLREPSSFAEAQVNKQAHGPFPSQPAMPPHMLASPQHHDPSQAYIWAPIGQTPRHIRRGLFAAAADEATDTDNSPDVVRTIMAPPQTPSGRRSPGKGEKDRGRSPTKAGRSPSKGC
ncbi:nuclear envelope protein [Coniochaeta sp. 2T2.1]|nr:nuclear envelope protein [Coniochaeta sp. 2T2.1]